MELAPKLRSLEGLSIEHNGEAFTSAAWDRVLPVDGGEHVFELRAPGYAPSRRAVTVLREGDEATIRLPALRRAAPANSADSVPLRSLGTRARASFKSRGSRSGRPLSLPVGDRIATASSVIHGG